MRTTVNSPSLGQALAATLQAAALGVMLLAPAGDVSAEEDPRPSENARELRRQILWSLDDPELGLNPLDDPSEEPWFSGFHLSTKGPIQYRRTLQLGDDEVSVRLYGPVIKKKPGLRFRIEGLNFGEHDVQVDGFGNVKEGMLRFTVDF